MTGTQDRGNGGRGVGIEQNSSDNLIGGTAPQARNLISANTNVGLRVFGPGATGNRIEGNFIGTDATGKQALGNRNGGVLILGQSLNVIGGTDAGAGNVISGNDFNRDESGNIVGASAGLTIARPGAKMNLVQGNIIGADVTGTAALGNPQLSRTPREYAGRAVWMFLAIASMLQYRFAILIWAVHASVGAVSLVTIGWILLIVGAVGALLSMIFWSSWGGVGGPADRRRTVVREDY